MQTWKHWHAESFSPIALFHNGNEESDRILGDNNNGELNILPRALQRCEHHGSVNSKLPETFQTNHLLFYERFKAYQDYMLGNCDAR